MSGKIVIPFCTHGTGGLASTVQDIKKALPQDATLLDPTGVYRPDVDSSQDKVNKWLDGIYGAICFHKENIVLYIL